MNDTQKQAAWLVEMYQHVAEGGELECCDGTEDWITCLYGPTMHSIPVYWRKKHRTININGHEVPEPLREHLKRGKSYYIPNIVFPAHYITILWTSDDIDMRWLNDGLIHATKEAAIAHAEALLSFTRMEVSDGIC